MILIVGAGIFGQVIAAKLRQDGHEVQLFDSNKPESGSKPSGGHLKPSWLAFLDKKVMDNAFRTLDDLYKLETIKCQYGPLSVDLMRVDIDRVLEAGGVLPSNVTAVGDGYLEYDDLTCAGGHFRAEGTVIVAAGVWSSQLLPQFAHELSAKKGMSFTFKGVSAKNPPTNTISQWAPYKQVVRTQHGPGQVWIGDGSAIIPTNWDEAREAQIKDRVMTHVDFKYKSMNVQRGLRPYMQHGLRLVAPHLWLATGGGKSGMALAGVYANRLSELLK